MIEATETEVKAYCIAMVHEVEAKEYQHGNKSYPTWLGADELSERIAQGLQCTVSAAQAMVRDLIMNQYLVLDVSGRKVKYKQQGEAA